MPIMRALHQSATYMVTHAGASYSVTRQCRLAVTQGVGRLFDSEHRSENTDQIYRPILSNRYVI